MEKIDRALNDPAYEGFGKKAMIVFSMGLDSTTLAYYLRHRGYQVDLAFFDDGPWNTEDNGFYDDKRPIVETDFLRLEFEHYADWHAARAGFGKKIFRFPQLNALAVQPGAARFPDTDKAKEAEALGMTYWVGYKWLMQAITMCHGAAYGYDLVVMGHLPGEDAYADETPEAFALQSGALAHVYHRVTMPRFENPYYDWNFTKKQVIGLAKRLGVPLHMTYSCRRMPLVFNEALQIYEHCGQCEMCRVRKEAFESAGSSDPAVYSKSVDPKADAYRPLEYRGDGA